MFEGRLLAIQISPAAGKPMTAIDHVEAIAGKGLFGDRYADGNGAFQRSGTKPSQQVTLIESEAVEAVRRDYKLDITPADTRRNLVTEGVPLNHLVGQDFRIGDVTLRGLRLCEPCSYLEELTCQGIERALKHRGGLRATVLTGGVLHVGDTVGLLNP